MPFARLILSIVALSMSLAAQAQVYPAKVISDGRITVE